MKSSPERLISVGYMLCTSGFSCGNCVFLTGRGMAKSSLEAAFCRNKEVQQVVDPVYGCCNEFEPKHAEDKLWPL